MLIIINKCVIEDTPRRGARRPTNEPSQVLSESENFALFSSLGDDRVCLYAGVTELLESKGD